MRLSRGTRGQQLSLARWIPFISLRLLCAVVFARYHDQTGSVDLHARAARSAHARRFIPAFFLFFFFLKQLLEEQQKSSSPDEGAPAGPTSQFRVYRQTVLNKYQEVCPISLLLSVVLLAWPSDAHRPPGDSVLLLGFTALPPQTS